MCIEVTPVHFPRELRECGAAITDTGHDIVLRGSSKSVDHAKYNAETSDLHKGCKSTDTVHSVNQTICI